LANVLPNKFNSQQYFMRCLFFSEVKAEIRDDAQQLCRSSNGHFELFLLTAEGSNSDGNSSGVSKLASLKQVINKA
jgi:hypothetical protein